ncbi:heparinase [Altericroceibacterium spongiae]|uniref:Heparinase n=1 Tax=Altericroceibacterium spongiae TaxID=2320269 RepID=A0A420EP76_9SPHN|nr:heparinase II/III family protein [Altericroceibacterium spongiae]RKF22475.1 heparinase [Altericroceibacterium spongiae]
MKEAAISGRLALEGDAAGDAQDMALPLDSLHEDLVLQDEEENGERGELIQPGRSLAVTHFAPPSIGPAERFMRFAYRLGVPGSTLAAPFRKPARPRLLATVESPLEGNRQAGMALRAGHFLIHGVKAPIAQLDFSPTAKITPPFERAMHGFGWLRDLAASGTRDQCSQTAERLFINWMNANPEIGKGMPWKVEHAGHRLLNWLVYAPLIMSGSDKALRNRVLTLMADTARWLDRNVNHADDLLGEITGWCAITAAGLLLPDGKPRRLYGEAGLIHALGDFVGEDGGVLSRSPLGQMELMTLLMDLSACYRAMRLPVPDALEAMQTMLVPPLLALVHSDGGLGCWQGSGALDAQALSALIEASGVRTRPLRNPRQWGYQRVATKGSVLQFDTAPPPLARHARHGCASTLAFEFSHGPHRLIVNCGGAAFAGGQVPVRVEQGLRATAAHSTLVLDDANSTAVLIKGKLGKGVNEVELDRRLLESENGTATRIEASHDGYASRFGLIHRRILILRDDGTELRGEDLLLPSGRRGQKGKVPYALRFHIGPAIELGLAENRKNVGFALPDGSYWQFVSGSGEVAIEESMWIDGSGRAHPIQQLVLQGLASRGGGNFSWLLKKMG